MFFFPCFIVATSCLEPYNPPAIKEVVDLLVVDGFLNASDSSVNVHLSKALAISEDGSPQPELHANVRVEEENGIVYPLAEAGEGNYFLKKMDVDLSRRYRLYITTQNEKVYSSDFIDLPSSPAIDSITWKPGVQDEGIGIYVNTHDPLNKTHYYQWTFEETWEYTSGNFSSYKIQNGVVVPQDQNIYRCWTSRPSTEIHIGTSNQLNEDVIRDFQLMFIPIGSEKLFRKFSIEVQQRALTKDAYDFWLQLKKTTESLGGLFDPLPSQVLGNLRSSGGDSEPVLGYFSGGQAVKKRIFISIVDLPRELRRLVPLFCPMDSIDVNSIASFPDMNLIASYGMPFIQGYFTSYEKNCVDCRDNGGDIVRPDFWE